MPDDNASKRTMEIARKPVGSENAAKQLSDDYTAQIAARRAFSGSQINPEHAEDARIAQDVEALAAPLSRMDLESPERTKMDNVGSVPTVKSSRGRQKVSRSSLDKALPTPPGDDDEFDSKDDREYFQAPIPPIHQDTGAFARLRGDHYEDSVDTIHHKSWAPAVTHDTVRQDVHEIQHQPITREHHEYHIYHRVLPVRDVEVRPARHWVQDADGKYREVLADQVPGRCPEYTDLLMSEVYKETLPKDSSGAQSRQFTAREFAGTEGDYKDYRTTDGTPRTEQWWVHSPTLEEGAKQSGETQPFYLG